MPREGFTITFQRNDYDDAIKATVSTIVGGNSGPHTTLNVGAGEVREWAQLCYDLSHQVDPRPVAEGMIAAVSARLEAELDKSLARMEQVRDAARQYKDAA